MRDAAEVGWVELALIGQNIAFRMWAFVLGVNSVFAVRMLAFVVVDPSRERIMTALLIFCVGWPIFVVASLLVVSLPSIVSFHARIVKCADQIHAQQFNAERDEVRWCLGQFRWVHRLACRLSGRRYSRLLACCAACEATDESVDRDMNEVDPSERQEFDDRTVWKFLRSHASERFLNRRNRRDPEGEGNSESAGR